MKTITVTALQLRSGMRLDMSEEGLSDDVKVEFVNEFAYIKEQGGANEEILATTIQVAWVSPEDRAIDAQGYTQRDDFIVPATQEFKLHVVI